MSNTTYSNWNDHCLAPCTSNYSSGGPSMPASITVGAAESAAPCPNPCPDTYPNPCPTPCPDPCGALHGPCPPDACCPYQDACPPYISICVQFPLSLLTDILFSKVDAAGRALAGAEYQLISPFGLPPQTATSGADGQVLFTDMPPGFYYLHETAVPAGYTADEQTYPVVVGLNGEVTINGQPAALFKTALHSTN